MKTIILIGPQGAGKSTVARLICERYGLSRFSFDEARDQIFPRFGYDPQVADQIYAENGEWALYRYWKPFELKMVRWALDSPPADVLDFGAGHSVFEEERDLAEVDRLLAPFENVFLLVPSDDIDETLRILGSRKQASQLTRHFLEHPSNARLAKHVVYSVGRTAEEVVALIMNMTSALAQSDPALR